MFRQSKSFWLCLGLFVVSYLSLRLFWIDGDPGIGAVWEYGYNATDEGYYLSGGKEKYLWNFFVDLSRTEVFTYGFSAGTHYLSYLAHLLFGLSTWTWRIPFLAICATAWIVMFVHLARKIKPFNALMLCLATSSVPMLIAYERTASNDVLIGSLAVIAYVIATGASRRHLFSAAFVVGLISLVKPSVWVLIPVVAAGVLQSPKFRSRWWDLVSFVITATICVFVWKFIVALVVLPDAHQAGVSAWEIVKRTTTHYPLPNLFDIGSHLKGLSAFPRDPSYALLGVTSVFIFVLPLAMGVKNFALRRFNGNTLLFVSIPTYVAAINVMNTQYTHYFIPAMMFLPIVCSAVISEIRVTEDEAFCLKDFLRPLFVILVFCAVGVILLLSFQLNPQLAQQYYSKIYNFPGKNVWGATAVLMGIFIMAIFIVMIVLRGLSSVRVNGLAWLVSAFFASSITFAAIPAISIAPYLRQSSDIYFAPMSVTMVTSVLLLVMIFGMKGLLSRNGIMPVFVFGTILVCYLSTPNWRKAACELLRSPTHHHADAAREIATILPSDAIVIGERSNQMLMSLPIRTATTFAANSDPIPVIKSIKANNPHAKLYALVDSQHAYNLQHYREHSSEYALHLLKTIKMPSFSTGSLADVYLCMIETLPKK